MGEANISYFSSDLVILRALYFKEVATKIVNFNFGSCSYSDINIITTITITVVGTKATTLNLKITTTN